MEGRDAAQIVAWLVAAFPSVTLEEHSVELWVRLVGELKDAEAATKTALEYSRNGERFPTFPEFRRSYLRLKERTAEGVAVAELEAGSALECPGWVRMYDYLRKTGDLRALPDQEIGYRAGRMVWPPEEGVVPQEEVDQWVAEHPTIADQPPPVLSYSSMLRSID